MPEIKTGEIVETEWWPESVTVTEDTDISDISSTSFTPGSPVCATTFVAPRSGRVGVAVSAEMREESLGNRLFVSYEIYQGTSAAGTLVRSARAGFGVSTNGDAGGTSQFMTLGNMSMVENLVEGATHYIRTMHSVDAGTTNDIGLRRLTVIPLA